MGKYHITVIESQRYDSSHRIVTSHRESQSQSHDKSNMRTIGEQSIATKVKCISSIENPMETLLSSSCQLR